ncbi:MAG: methylated-DNA--[protein]-cysteine S-methyltransferase [Sphingobacteriales bacterium]|jgi:methylated-DNA-[protein]-cysteine S-methyltransferase|nr:MAG: methylated-DNA--[protein]-cysteine S-methyltransferase [Sphingobacteriales bacterium]
MLYAYVQSPIGLIAITETDGFITSLLFVDAKTHLETETVLLAQAKQQINAYFAGTLKQFSLPIKQKGTAFRQAVWLSLHDIGYAHTIAYSTLASRMNNKLAIRAIAAANGKNAIMLLVPCHRVLGINGEMTGYAGEIWRKQWLLNHESKIAGLGQVSLAL